MPSQIRGLRQRSIPRRKVTTDVDAEVTIRTRVSENIADDAVTTTEFTIDDTQTPTGDTGTLSTLLSWIGKMLKSITGKASWRTAPVRTLEQCVDTAGLTTGTVPIATASQTLADSRIKKDGADGHIHIPYLSGDTLPALSIGGSGSNRAGLYATTASGTGAYGESSSGSGVYGKSITSFGVYGESDTGIGVKGISDSDIGVYAISVTGTAIHAESVGSAVPTVEIIQSGTGKGISVTQGSNASALYIAHSGSGSSASAIEVSAIGNISSGDMVTLSHSGTSYTGSGYRVSLTSSGHGVKVLQQGTGKGGEFTIANSGNSSVCVDAYTNGSGVAVKGKTEGAGRAGYFEANRSSATDPAVEIKVVNTSDSGVGLLINGLGTGSMLKVQDNGTSVLEVKDGSKIGFFGVTPVVRAAALTAKDASTVDATYGTQERDVINNLRTRLNEIETALQGIGIIN